MFSLVSVILSIGVHAWSQVPSTGVHALFRVSSGGVGIPGGGQVYRKYISMIDKELSVKPLHLLHSTISSYVSILDCCTEMSLSSLLIKYADLTNQQEMLFHYNTISTP